jgi:serine/threonine protein phosphatase PrpC
MWLLLCTDGLFRGVAPDEVRDWFKPDADAARICEKLVALVNSRGGPDNSTVITPSAATPEERREYPIRRSRSPRKGG